MAKYLKFMNNYIKVVDQLSTFVKWSKENQQMGPMYVERDIGKNILSYVDFSKICYVIKYFSELKQDFGEEGIAFPSSSSSIAIEWRNEHLLELELYVDKIDTSLYGDFTINTRHFKDYFIFILGNDMRDTCGGIYKNNINSWGFFSLPCV